MQSIKLSEAEHLHHISNPLTCPICKKEGGLEYESDSVDIREKYVNIAINCSLCEGRFIEYYKLDDVGNAEVP